MDEAPLPVAETIKKIGLTKLATEMSLPFSTLHRWQEADAIPGDDSKNGNWRRRLFEQTARKMLNQDAA